MTREILANSVAFLLQCPDCDKIKKHYKWIDFEQLNALDIENFKIAKEKGRLIIKNLQCDNCNGCAYDQ